MCNTLKKVWRDESAQDLAEYGIALAVIAAAVAAIAIAFGGNVITLWTNGQTAVQNAAGAGA